MAAPADSASPECPAAPSMPTDPDFLSCVLQPPAPSSSRPDADYTALRRLLLRRKPPSALQHRMDWWCNGKGYVAYRNFLLRRIDGGSAHSTPSNSGRWAASPGPALSEADSWSSLRDLRTNNSGLSRTVSISSKQSDTERHVRFAEPAYSFVGMHCIFDSCKTSVTILKFGRASSDLLAYGAADGSLTVCQVSEPPSVLQKLIGHSKNITDFDFSSNNQYIASCSLDKTVRVWEISKGTCIRVVYGVTSQLCICFHPVNNNLLLVGNSNKEINAINFSTGRVISKLNFDDAVTALDIDHTGQLIFAGDAQGYIYTVSVNSHTGSLSRTHKNKSSKSKSPITTIQYRTFSLVARCPVLLSCAQDGYLSFFSIATDAKGYLTLISSLKLASRVQTIRASFCPFLSLEKGEFIVTGSEDANVYFYDLARPKNSCVNKLQGHGSPVIGVAWNHGENLLASSDSDGTVIVWKRAKTN
ncbi:WD repeat-containing protein 13-like [Panicum virgatum]|uniref:WD repeat-containing protein 13 n=1 Tax=Panicum virgatum TaxID=38727 RepID=A0A8T0S1Q1_PANVG|nr:WD repeat-containing protein 13-like [Panicum virgatum]KAG2592107.1 hypothetical protein PVAP13_5NG525700 [Panicum virgatum]